MSQSQSFVKFSYLGGDAEAAALKAMLQSSRDARDRSEVKIDFTEGAPTMIAFLLDSFHVSCQCISPNFFIKRLDF